MLARTLFALSLILGPVASAGAGPKAAKPERECPQPHYQFDQIVQDIEKASTCAASRELFKACAGGASGDVQFGAAVQERCERDFLAKLSNTQKRAYDAAHKRCERKYIKKEGSMYRSAEAFCHANVAEKYVRRFSKAAPRK